MKKWLIYLGGIATGVVLVLVTVFVSNYEFASYNGADTEYESTMQDNVQKDNFLSTISGEILVEPGEIINEKTFKVFQVYTNFASLVRGKSGDYYYGAIYLLVRDKSTMFTEPGFEFYDDQIIKVPKGKVVRMFGTYKYTTRDGQYKTVPRIMIVDK